MLILMNPSAVNPLALPAATGAGSTALLPSSGGSGASAAPFSDLFTEAVGQVTALEGQAQAAATGLMTGSDVDVHQAMIAAQKASMAFELALSVRNKAVQAYQQVIGMQF
jgi:flagellar hook-basal body complex protein FliE